MVQWVNGGAGARHQAQQRQGVRGPVRVVALGRWCGGEGVGPQRGAGARVQEVPHRPTAPPLLKTHWLF